MAKAKTPKQSAHIELAYFLTKYEDKFGRKLLINKYALQWPMIDFINDFGYDDVHGLIDYFFSLERGSYTVESFYQNFDKLIKSKEERERRIVERAALLEQTRLAVEEFKGKNG